MDSQCGVGEDARGCPWSSSKKVEAARCAAAHSEEHSPTCDPAPDHITAPAVDARYGVHVLAPHGEGPRRKSCIERLGSVRYMLLTGPDNRTSHRKPPVRRDSASPRSTCPPPLHATTHGHGIRARVCRLPAADATVHRPRPPRTRQAHPRHTRGMPMECDTTPARVCARGPDTPAAVLGDVLVPALGDEALGFPGEGGGEATQGHGEGVVGGLPWRCR